MAQDIIELLGEKFEGFKGQDAINKLMKEKRGHIPDAFYRDDLGDIALIWGDETTGLAHIIKRRTEERINISTFLSDLDDIIENGEIGLGKNGCFEILKGRKMAIISPELKDNKFVFVLTAFKTRKKRLNKT